MFQEELNELFDIYSLLDLAAREDLQTEGLRHSIKLFHKMLSEDRDCGLEPVSFTGLGSGQIVLAATTP